MVKGQGEILPKTVVRSLKTLPPSAGEKASRIVRSYVRLGTRKMGERQHSYPIQVLDDALIPGRLGELLQKYGVPSDPSGFLVEEVTEYLLGLGKARRRVSHAVDQSGHSIDVVPGRQAHTSDYSGRPQRLISDDLYDISLPSTPGQEHRAIGKWFNGGEGRRKRSSF